MATYYVREQGAVISKQDQRLRVTKDNALVHDIPLHQLDQLIVMGNVQLTTQAVATLLKSQVDVVFMSLGGRIHGRLLSDDSKYAELRLRQLQVMSDPAASLEIARRIVLGKLANQLGLLQRLPLNAQNAKEQNALVTQRPFLAAIRGIPDMSSKAALADNPDSLRGFEGKAGAYYWPAYRIFLADRMGFKERLYFPPPDPINALLSFCYALLQKDVTAAVRLVGLDPYLGCFHTVQYGRPSLVLDLMEEFRPVVVDPLVLRLVNLGTIKERDFQRGTGDHKPLHLTDAAVRRVLQAYEERATGPAAYPLTGEQTSMRRCFELQARQLARVLKAEAAEYVPFVVAPAAQQAALPAPARPGGQA